MNQWEGWDVHIILTWYREPRVRNREKKSQTPSLFSSFRELGRWRRILILLHHLHRWILNIIWVLSDHPRIVITPIKLKGPNYDEWEKTVRCALIAKWKFGFVDGLILEPTTDSMKQKHWIVVNSMLVSWLTNTLDDSLRSTIDNYDVVSELWLHLKHCYCVVSGTRVCHLKQALNTCKQASTECVTEYFRAPIIRFFQNSLCPVSGW